MSNFSSQAVSFESSVTFTRSESMHYSKTCLDLLFLIEVESFQRASRLKANDCAGLNVIIDQVFSSLKLKTLS